ncbi:hypothetical protein AB0894_06440 [Streptomyces sp. NPDC047916]|uniref:hypothetical protein n=1 Tax=Streptomyces sp. NPDC047916 TaxID=3156681 RepID=UPI00345564CC
MTFRVLRSSVTVKDDRHSSIGSWCSLAARVLQSSVAVADDHDGDEVVGCIKSQEL